MQIKKHVFFPLILLCFAQPGTKGGTSKYMSAGIPRVMGDRKGPQGTQSSEDMSISNPETGEKGRQRAKTGPRLEDIMEGGGI